MRAVLISAYVVLLLAIVSEGPAHAQENGTQLETVLATANKNAANLASLVEIAGEAQGFLESVAKSMASITGMMNQYIGHFISGTHTGCEMNNTQYRHGSTLDGDWTCNPTCTKGKWIIDKSSLCCDYNDEWYSTGTNINEEGVNRTCVDGNWNMIVYSPALEFRLLPRKENVESILIRYNPGISSGDGRNWDGMKHWVNSLNEIIQPYYQSNDDIDSKNCNDDNGVSVGEVCRFERWMIGDKCSKDNGWGYSQGTPCILLKMNRMIGWTPDVYKKMDELPADMPEELKEYIKQKTDDNRGRVPKMVWVYCKCENPTHEEYCEMKYSPWNGFPAYYFPYQETPGYLDPIVALRFVALPNNVPINVECKAYAKNIVRNKQDRLGVIHFEVKKIE